jgi:hypothetical protein
MSSYELHRVVAGGSDADGLKSLEKLAFVEPSSSAVISDAALKCMIVRPRDPRLPPSRSPPPSSVWPPSTCELGGERYPPPPGHHLAARRCALLRAAVLLVSFSIVM